MLRILFDPLGDGHGDLFLKIDALPSFIAVTDSYWFPTFLSIQENPLTLLTIVSLYVDYLQGKVASMEKVPIFIPFDLSDEYVGGLLLHEHNSELIKISYGFSRQVQGYSIHSKKEIPIAGLEFQEQRQWLISKVQIFEGLEWSRQQISKNID